MIKNQLRLWAATFLLLMGMAAGAETSIKVNLTDASLISDEVTSQKSFGISQAADGTLAVVAADAEDAVLVISASSFNGRQHGWVDLTATIKVEGPVKVGLGNCTYGNHTAYITDVAGNKTEFETTAECWEAGKPTERVTYAYYKGTAATTLTIKAASYTPYISVETVDASELKDEVTLSFAAGEGEGEVPASVKKEVGSTYQLPTNYTLYVEGKTLTAWTDGTNNYLPGQEITVPEANTTLTAVYTDNAVALGDRTEPVTLRWNFRKDQGAPVLNFEGRNGFLVTQATIGTAVIDVKMPFTTSPGKLNNANNSDWAQCNNGTTFTLPSAKGAVVSLEAYNELGAEGKTATTIDGQSDYTVGKTVSYTIAGTAETINVVIGNDAVYLRYVQVTLPVVQQQGQGGKVFDQVTGTVKWPVGNEEVATISDELNGAFSNVGYSTGDALTIDAATYFETQMVKYTPVNSNAGNVEGVMIEYRVKAAAGLTFKPTNVSYAAVKVGTDGATYSYSYTLDGEESTITEQPATGLLRNNGANSSTAELMHSHDITADGVSEFSFRIYVSKTANNKNLCFGNVTISGIVNGTTEAVTMHTISIAASPETGGQVSIYPKDNEFEEGTNVTLTATKNFGYKFVNWTDAEGNVVSENAKFVYTLDADAVLTANFEQVNTYELALTVDGTNSYMVEVNPAPTVVDGKNMYEEGTAVQLTANQYEGLVTFTNWNDGETNSEKLISMTANTTLTAYYAEADIIAGWDFYTAGGSGRKADFYAQDNDADALSLVSETDGSSSGWLDKSTEAANGYESFRGAAVNWRTGSANGDVGHYYWQTKVNAAAFTDINVQFQMMYNYNSYTVYDVEYSTDGENYTKAGSITMEGAKKAASYSGTLPEAANNKAELYIRLIADKTSSIDGTASANDGNALAMFFITGTPKLVNDGVAPALESTVPTNGATGASATGKIVLTFDERVKVAEGTKATLGSTTLEPIVSGKAITFEYKGLEYSTEYTFTLPANTVADLGDNYMTEAITLTFTTMNRPTVSKALYDKIVSNADELLAAIAEANSRSDKNVRYRIFLKNGNYTLPLSTTLKTVNNFEVPECITFINASNISFIGESRDGVVISNAIPADATFAGQYGTTSKYDGIGNSDVLQLASSVRGTYFQDLTVKSGIGDALGRNLAIQDKGSQTIYKNTVLYGYQDTWTSNNDNGLYYFEGGVVRGRTDFLCGKGDAFFNAVEIRMLKGGYIAVPSKSIKYGYTFKDCVINGDENGVDGNYTLGRPWGSGTPVALWIDTRMNVAPSAIGWNEMSGGWPLRFAEYNSTTKNGTVIDLSGRKKIFADTHENNPVLSAEEALEAGNLHNMYGDWDPTLATEQAPVPTNVQLNGTTLTWDNSNYALLWAVVKNGNVVDFTIEPTYTVDDTTAQWAVRAANEMGGLGEAATTGVSEGISVLTTATQQEAIYNLQGVRVDKANKGLYIVNGRKIVVR